MDVNNSSTVKTGPLRVLVVGGRGYFGRRLVKKLAGISGIEVFAGGRRPRPEANYRQLNVQSPDLASRICALEADVVVAAMGPFKGDWESYRVANAALDAGAHYIDLADGRKHVKGIATLDRRAKQEGVTVISGASSVPGLSSAVIDHLARDFQALQRVEYGITASELTPGLDSVRSALRYCGRSIDCKAAGPIYGWEDGIWKSFEKPLGRRWLLNCDVPDLDLFPDRYGMDEVRFRAGVPGLPHMAAMRVLAWLVRHGWLASAAPLAVPLHRISRGLEIFGSGRSGMYVRLSGEDPQGLPLVREWQLLAENNDGPYVPIVPIVALVRRLTRETPEPGAYPCLGRLSLEELVAEFADLRITCVEVEKPGGRPGFTQEALSGIRS